MERSHKNSPSLERMLRVNQAGEHGAIRIYAGQRAVLGDSSVGADLKHMEEQEAEHKALFDDLLVKYRVRPTFLSPLWHVAGYGLGMATALMGKKAAMACTVAVEEVIDDHYQRQLKDLKDMEVSEEITTTIEKCREEELEHRDLALEREARSFVGYVPLSLAVKSASRLAIWLSKRL